MGRQRGRHFGFGQHLGWQGVRYIGSGQHCGWQEGEYKDKQLKSDSHGFASTYQKIKKVLIISQYADIYI